MNYARPVTQEITRKPLRMLRAAQKSKKRFDRRFRGIFRAPAGFVAGNRRVPADSI
jgi:hypothetical protein